MYSKQNIMSTCLVSWFIKESHNNFIFFGGEIREYVNTNRKMLLLDTKSTDIFKIHIIKLYYAYEISYRILHLFVNLKLGTRIKHIK